MKRFLICVAAMATMAACSSTDPEPIVPIPTPVTGTPIKVTATADQIPGGLDGLTNDHYIWSTEDKMTVLSSDGTMHSLALKEGADTKVGLFSGRAGKGLSRIVNGFNSKGLDKDSQQFVLRVDEQDGNSYGDCLPMISKTLVDANEGEVAVDMMHACAEVHVSMSVDCAYVFGYSIKKIEVTGFKSAGVIDLSKEYQDGVSLYEDVEVADAKETITIDYDYPLLEEAVTDGTGLLDADLSVPFKFSIIPCTIESSNDITIKLYLEKKGEPSVVATAKYNKANFYGFATDYKRGYWYQINYVVEPHVKK